MATLKDIAARSGFSVAVVSRALSPRPDQNALVALATRRLLVRLAHDMGFRRNRTAEYMQRGGSPTVGVFLPARANRLVADLVFGISEALAEVDLPLQIGFDNYVDGLRRFIRYNVDLSYSGIISYSPLLDAPAVEREVGEYRSKGGKIVLLNTLIQLSDVPVVSIDNRQGGRLAAARLLARGCRRMAVVGAFAGRNEGFRQELAKAGMTPREFPEEAAGSRVLARFCRDASADAPTGIFAVTDVLALRVMKALSQTSHSIGRNVLLIGYDDLDLTAEVTPALTTIHQPFLEEGRLAGRKLTRMINGEQESSVSIPPRLVIRASA